MTGASALMLHFIFRYCQAMTFSATTKPGAILFTSWEPESTGAYVAALFGVAAIGVGHQLIVFARASHFRWAAAKRIAEPDKFSALTHQMVDAALFAIVAAASYVAMLVAMSTFPRPYLPRALRFCGPGGKLRGGIS